MSKAISNLPAKPLLERSPEAIEAAAKLRWTGCIIIFFILQFILWSVAITLTNSDPSHAIDRAYNQQDDDWNQRRAVQLASDSLQWTASIRIDDSADFRGERAVHLTLTDREGQPVSDAAVAGYTFHQSRAKESQSLQFNEQSAGEYVAMARIRRDGEWRFDLQASKGESVFLCQEIIAFNAQHSLTARKE